MAALALPSFHTTSKRDLFTDAAVTPVSKRDGPDELQDEQIVFYTGLAGIEVSSVPSHSPSKSSSSKSNGRPGKRKKSRSPKKRSPFKLPLSPKKKSPTKTENGFFTRLYYSLAGYNANGVYRPAPVAKGVYFDCHHIPIHSVKTLDTTHTTHSTEEVVYEWLASNLEGHTRGVPGVVRRPEYDVYDELDDRKLLKKIMTKAKRLPQEPGKYASNHVMVNAERAKRNIPPLRRERYFDQIAREQAKIMAEEENLFHIENPTVLKLRLKELDKESQELPDLSRLGTNIGRGKDIVEAQRFMMAALAERNNIQDKRFFYFGMGTWIADSGVLYMCQVFGG